MSEVEDDARYRLDKWLWAARFFKTRTLAAQAVDGGKVSVNGRRSKPARQLHVGDELQIHIGDTEYVVIVNDLARRRGPAVVAQQLYRETEASRLAREHAREQRRVAGPLRADPGTKPDKKSRRQIARFLRRDR